MASKNTEKQHQPTTPAHKSKTSITHPSKSVRKSSFHAKCMDSTPLVEFPPVYRRESREIYQRIPSDPGDHQKLIEVDRITTNGENIIDDTESQVENLVHSTEESKSDSLVTRLENELIAREELIKSMEKDIVQLKVVIAEKFIALTEGSKKGSRRPIATSSRPSTSSIQSSVKSSPAAIVAQPKKHATQLGKVPWKKTKPNQEKSTVTSDSDATKVLSKGKQMTLAKLSEKKFKSEHNITSAKVTKPVKKSPAYRPLSGPQAVTVPSVLLQDEIIEALTETARVLLLLKSSQLK